MSALYLLRQHLRETRKQQARALQLEARARHMRFHPTPTEAALWQELRASQLGVRFKRQVVIGNAIVDFLAPSRSLVIEVDGDAYHAQRAAADARREQKLERAGYTVLRFSASDVQYQLHNVVRLIRGQLG
ncbi:MAG: endonuclease domain-containing protein [Polyangiaceae bacterium]|nr:endonuclease domain-containing protein [Polyangiaceae bacterium]